jgi:hypothetical protein
MIFVPCCCCLHDTLELSFYLFTYLVYDFKLCWQFFILKSPCSVMGMFSLPFLNSDGDSGEQTEFCFEYVMKLIIYSYTKYVWFFIRIPWDRGDEEKQGVTQILNKCGSIKCATKHCLFSQLKDSSY